MFESDAQVIGTWLHGLSPNTQSAYRLDIEQFRRFVQMPLRAIKLPDLQRYQSHLERSPGRDGGKLSTATIHRKIAAIQSLYKFCVQQGYCSQSPAAGLRNNRPQRHVADKILPKPDIIKLIDSAATPMDTAFLRFLYYTGCRVSEAVAVQWSDFLARPDGQWQVQIIGKGAKLRLNLIPAPLWDCLIGLPKVSDRVFNFSRQSGHIKIKKAALKAGINPKTSCHWLRHGHATHALLAGAPIVLIRDQLGHASIDTTDLYLSSLPNESSATYL